MRRLALALALLTAGCGTEGGRETDAAAVVAQAPAGAQHCVHLGPQAPRDIANTSGLNTQAFPLAPPATEMNLCNIHTHTNAEHKGPGFSVFVSDADDGGFACNETPELGAAELSPAPGAYHGVEPGDTIEVHWVHTSCAAAPGEGLGACVPEACSDPLLRVEAQVFLVVNDSEALDFAGLAYGGNIVDGRHQAKSIPSTTGDPVLFRGLDHRAVIRSKQLFRSPRDVERPATVRQARHQLAAPLGRARERVQRNAFARRPPVGHGAGVALTDRVMRRHPGQSHGRVR